MKTPVTRLLRGGLMASLFVLSGCGDAAKYLDPYKKPYVWRPTGAPTANLAAQLVNPRDLAIGRGASEGDAKEAVTAIDRVWQDRPKQTSVASSSAGTGGGAPGAGAGAGAGGGTN